MYVLCDVLVLSSVRDTPRRVRSSNCIRASTNLPQTSWLGRVGPVSSGRPRATLQQRKGALLRFAKKLRAFSWGPSLLHNSGSQHSSSFPSRSPVWPTSLATCRGRGLGAPRGRRRTVSCSRAGASRSGRASGSSQSRAARRLGRASTIRGLHGAPATPAAWSSVRQPLGPPVP